MPKKDGKSLDFTKKFLYYMGCWFIAYILTYKYVPIPIQQFLNKRVIWDLFLIIGTFFSVIGAKNIFLEEVLYRTGERLKSQERRVRKEALDFDAVRKDV